MNNISVLMCVYKNDSVKYFDEAFHSIIEQTLKPDQIVLVRDGKVPSELQNHLDCLKKTYSELLTIVELEDNVGLSRALNIGINYCKYNYIARMDSDDISVKFRFSEQIPILINNDKIALVSSWYDQYDEKMEYKLTDRKVPQNHSDIVKFSKIRTPFNHSCAIFRKDAVLACGKYPEITSNCEDWWLALRLIKNGYHLENVQKSLVKVRGGVDFYGRRSGYRYFMVELDNYLKMFREDLISFSNLAKIILYRLPVRLLPQSVVEKIYINHIRT